LLTCRNMPVKLKLHALALLLIPAVLTLFWPALLHPFSVLFPTFSPFSDVMVIHWPKSQLIAHSWQTGEGLPHWTPLILSGMPLAANQLAMLFYPLAWLFLFLPAEPVFNLLFIFHLLWGGFGIYLLLHEGYKLSSAAALLGGLTFALNGKLLAHVAGGHVSMIGAMAWLPWTIFGWQMVLAGSEEARRRRAEEQTKWPGGVARRGQEARSEGLPSAERPAGEQGRNLRRCVEPLLHSSGWVVLVAISLAMQIVTHTLPVIYSVYLMAAMTIWHVAMLRRGEEASQKTLNEPVPRLSPFASRLSYTLIPFFTSLILAGLLGAAQLLPLLELAQFSNRSLSLNEAVEFALSPAQLLVGLLLPTAQSGHEYVIYTGLVALLLAPFGLTRKNRWTWFYGLLFLFALLFALGPDNPLHSLFYYFAPGFRWVRTPARIFFVGGLAVAVLAGFGADRLAQKQWSAPAKKWLTRLTIAIAPLALLVGLGLAFSFGQAGPVYRAALALAIFIPAGLALILLRAQRFLSAQVTLVGLSLLLFLDLAWFDSSMLRFRPLHEALAPGRAAAEYLAQKQGYFRVYSPSYSLPTQTAAAAGLWLADGVEPVHLAVYDQYMARAGGYDDASFSVTIPKFTGPLESSLKDVEPNLKLLGLLNVEYLVSAFPMAWPGLTLEKEVEGSFIYRNEQALPRAWVAHQTLPAEAKWLAQLEALPDPANVAIVENPLKSVETLNVQPSTVEIIHYAADRIEIKTEIVEPGWLVLSEIWYPGWQATVNGAAQPVERVNGLLRGLYLSQPGSYQITLAYRPSSVMGGNWISGLTTGVIVAGVLAGWWAKRSRLNTQGQLQ
jgi:hypothetical protein